MPSRRSWRSRRRASADLAGGDQRQVDGLTHFGQCHQVRPGQHAVGGDVGVHDVAASGRSTNCPTNSVAATLLVFSQPSVATRPSRASIPSTNWVWKTQAHAAKPVGLQRKARVPITSAAEAQSRAARRIVCSFAHAAAQLAGNLEGLDNRPQHRAVDQLTAARPVQVDQVQVLSTFGRPMPSHGDRVFAEHGFLARKSPCLSRTHLPPRRSIAGQICMAAQSVSGPGVKQRTRARCLGSNERVP